MGKCKATNQFINLTLPKDAIKYVDMCVEVFNNEHFKDMRWTRSRFVNFAIWNLSQEMKALHEAKEDEKKGEEQDA